ncbi:hypothetical protein [Flavobacterium sp.]|uniref:hypothetical protein n=1 Tax=Flavobacterium sp. TaxID=239 RepID=UPI003A8EAD7D
MKTKLFILGACAALVFAACSKDENQNTNDFTLKASEEYSIANLQANAMKDLKQKFVFEANGEEALVEVKSGVKIRVKTATLKVGGQPYFGPVVVEYVEVFGRGAMLTANKTTSGLTNQPQSEDDTRPQPLISGGEFYVNMTTEEGENIDEGAEYQLEVPAELTGGEPDEDMTSWTGDQEDTDGDGESDDEGDVTWDEDEASDGDDDNGEGDKDVPVENGEYILKLREFGWCNIDKLAEYPNEKTTIFVDVPNGFDDTNSKVYLAFEGQQNMLVSLDHYDQGTQLFGETYNLLPVGEQCHIIFASGQGGQWIYAVQTITITPNGVYVVNAGSLVTATQADVINMLNSLP